MLVKTIRAVVEAYGKGEIELEPVSKDARKRHYSHVGRCQGILPFHGGPFPELRLIRQMGKQLRPAAWPSTPIIQEASIAEALASIPSAHRSERAIETVTTATAPCSRSRPPRPIMSILGLNVWK